VAFLKEPAAAASPSAPQNDRGLPPTGIDQSSPNPNETPMGNESVAEPIVHVSEVHKYFRRGAERLDVLKGLTLQVRKASSLA